MLINFFFCRLSIFLSNALVADVMTAARKQRGSYKRPPSRAMGNVNQRMRQSENTVSDNESGSEFVDVPPMNESPPPPRRSYNYKKLNECRSIQKPEVIKKKGPGRAPYQPRPRITAPPPQPQRMTVPMKDMPNELPLVSHRPIGQSHTAQQLDTLLPLPAERFYAPPAAAVPAAPPPPASQSRRRRIVADSSSEEELDFGGDDSVGEEEQPSAVYDQDGYVQEDLQLYMPEDHLITPLITPPLPAQQVVVPETPPPLPAMVDQTTMMIPYAAPHSPCPTTTVPKLTPPEERFGRNLGLDQLVAHKEKLRQRIALLISKDHMMYKHDDTELAIICEYIELVPETPIFLFSGGKPITQRSQLIEKVRTERRPIMVQYAIGCGSVVLEDKQQQNALSHLPHSSRDLHLLLEEREQEERVVRFIGKVERADVTGVQEYELAVAAKVENNFNLYIRAESTPPPPCISDVGLDRPSSPDHNILTHLRFGEKKIAVAKGLVERLPYIIKFEKDEFSHTFWRTHTTELTGLMDAGGQLAMYPDLFCHFQWNEVPLILERLDQEWQTWVKRKEEQDGTVWLQSISLYRRLLITQDKSLVEITNLHWRNLH